VQVEGLADNNPVATGTVLPAPLKSTVAFVPVDLRMPVNTLPPLTVVCALHTIAQKPNNVILLVIVERPRIPSETPHNGGSVGVAGRAHRGGGQVA
jgi:hypothetical protein